jgi:NADH-quinone oxidoreductase subunit F
MILEKGGKWFADLGIPNAGGTKIFSVSGHVQNPGNFEVPLGTPFKDLLEMAGGPLNGAKLKAVIPGGSSAPILPIETMMDLTMDYDSIAKAGSMLGSGAVIVMDESTCMVKLLARISAFYHEESCGQCTPCREGTGWMNKVIQRIAAGEGRIEDLDTLDSMAGNIRGRTICAFGDAAAMPIQAIIKQYRDEFEYMIKNGKSMVAVA